MLEIVNHLADEEVEDFRRRVLSTLEDPTRPWPPIDPEVWVRERAYDEHDLGESLQRLVAARAETVERLRALERPDWSKAHEHPSLGQLTAGDLMVSFAAHDALHLRQLAQRLLQLAQRDGEGHSTEYAGRW